MGEFPFRSLRDWISFLKEKEQLLHNEQQVSLRGEVAAISRNICDKNGPAVIHEDILGYPGWKIFSDGLTTRQRMAWGLGVEPQGMTQKLASMLKANKPMRPMEVSSGPCKEVKLFGDDIDLTRFPIPYTGEFDIPPYITAGISNIKDPETGWQNSGIRRFQLKGKRKITSLVQTSQHEGWIFRKYIQSGKPMPVAIVLGADPVYECLSQMPVPEQADEQDYWAVLTGEPLQVVKAETSDILVPANAEIIIEGVMDPHARQFEGPFSEFPGYYSGYNMCPIIDVQAITMRKDAYYRYLYMGMPPSEGHLMGYSMFETEIYRQAKELVPELRDVAILSVWSITTAASIDKDARKRLPGLHKRLALALKSCSAGRIIKNLIIVDDDIDVHNINEILWAFSVKFQPGKDITVMTGMLGALLDPSELSLGMGPQMTSFAVFDCTEPASPYDEPYRRGLALPTEEVTKLVQQKWNSYGFK